jgi:hypothetical protein
LGADEQEDNQGRRGNVVAERAAAVTSWARERKGERTVTGDGEKRDRRRITVGPEWIGKNKRAPQSRTGRAALPHRKRHCCTCPEKSDLATIKVTLFISDVDIYSPNFMTRTNNQCKLWSGSLELVLQIVLKHNMKFCFTILFLHILVDQLKGVQKFKPRYENQVYLAHCAKHKTLTHQEA